MSPGRLQRIRLPVPYGFRLGVSNETELGRTVLTATRPADPDYRAQFMALGQAQGAWMSVHIRCRAAYMREDCPRDTEVQLRTRLTSVVQAADLPLDPRQAQFGDEDFATWVEFGLFLGRLLIGFASAVVLAIVGVVAQVLKRPEHPVPPRS